MLEVAFLLSRTWMVQAVYEGFEDFREGFGDLFLEELFQLKDLLGNFQRMGSEIGRGFRKLKMTRFDHGIYYNIEGCAFSSPLCCTASRPRDYPQAPRPLIPAVRLASIRAKFDHSRVVCCFGSAK